MKAEYVDHMGDDLSVVNDARVSFAKKSDWDRRLDHYSEENDTDSWLDEGWVFSTETTSGDLYTRLSEEDTRLIQYLARGCSRLDWEDLISEIMIEKDFFEDVEAAVLSAQNMHTHWTPFAHQTIKLRMKAPVPIRTQCFKHKMGFVENEESRRYITSRPELYAPSDMTFRSAAKNVKQGSGGVHPRSGVWVDAYIGRCRKMINMYEKMVADGVCPEQARFVLPQGVMVNWIWTGNLASFARFYNQRKDPHAQKEIQDLAKAVGEIIEPLFPVSWKALTG